MIRFTDYAIIAQHYKTDLSDTADVSVTCAKNALVFILNNNSQGVANYIAVEGRNDLLELFMSNLNQIKPENRVFNIIEP